MPYQVVVNDFSKANADKIVAEINAAKGTPQRNVSPILCLVFANLTDMIAPGPGSAIANYDNVVEGKKIVQQAVDKFGTVHILVNNAGILRDKSFKAMTDKEFDDVQNVGIASSIGVASEDPVLTCSSSRSLL